MRTLLLALFISASIPAQNSVQRGAPDPVFDNIPFDQWLHESPQSNFHWSIKVSRAELSFHQRLVASLDITLDGRDFESRRRDGRLLFLMQVTDAAGAVYRQHGAIELSKLDPDVKNVNLQSIQRAFVLPGDYQLAAAILDTATSEHSAVQSKFHVAAPSQPLLTEAWRDVPSIEFLGNDVSPESWYLPYIDGRVQWLPPLPVPARLNLILNVSASIYNPGTRHAPSSGLSALLPSLKVLAESGSPSLSEHLALLDLSRRKAILNQNDLHALDWPSLKASLAQANTASIDIHSLETSQDDAQFFVSQVRSVLRSSSVKPCVLVILTQPVAFESGEDREPISTEALPSCRVFYLRFYATLAPSQPFEPLGQRGMGRHSGMGGPRMNSPVMHEALDQLESTLKPLNPKVFDIETPGQVTKALMEIQKAFLQ